MIDWFGAINVPTLAAAVVLAVFYDGPVKAFGRWVRARMRGG
jgi:hypothetical protein